MAAESKIQQYSLAQILLIWAAAAVPMGLLGWIVAPALAADPAKPGFERLAVLTVGLIWPFFVSNFEVTPLYRFLWFTSFHLSSIVMVYVMVESFRFYLNKSGKAWQVLNRNSYGVYIIHVIVIGVFGTLLLGVALPGWAKYLILFILSYAGSNLIVLLYRLVRSSLTSNRAQNTPQSADA